MDTLPEEAQRAVVVGYVNYKWRENIPTGVKRRKLEAQEALDWYSKGNDFYPSWAEWSIESQTQKRDESGLSGRRLATLTCFVFILGSFIYGYITHADGTVEAVEIPASSLPATASSQLAPPENAPAPTEIPIPPEFFRRDPGLAEIYYEFTVGVKWGPDIIKWAAQYPPTDPNLLAAILTVEACGDHTAHQWDNRTDKGMFQINVNAWPPNVYNLNYFNPDEAAVIGIGKIIQPYSQEYAGNPLMPAIVAGAYNGGPSGALYGGGFITYDALEGRVGASKAAIVDKYIRLVTGVYAEALRGDLHSATLEEGGFYLPHAYCATAAAVHGLPWPFPAEWVAAGR